VFVGEPALTAGMRWAETIEKAIKKCKVFVALCTPTYGESEASNWTYRELHTADRLRKPILAVWHSGPFPPLSEKSFRSAVPRSNKPLTDSTVAFDAAVAQLLDMLAMLGVHAVSCAGNATVEGRVELLERSRLSHKLQQMRGDGSSVGRRAQRRRSRAEARG